jgi:hypothetical protein
MTREQKITEITNAIRKLGETSHNIRVRDCGTVAEVHVNGEYFGVWSFVSKTFID